MNLPQGRTVVIILLLATLIASSFFGLKMRREGPSKEVEAFNEGVTFLEEGNLEEAVASFDKVTRIEPNNSELDAYAMYNIATVLGENVSSSEGLTLARSFALEALRLKPEETRIRKQVEILTEKLIDQLMKEGNSREEAEKLVDEKSEQGREEREGEGTKGGRGNSENDY